MNIVLLSGGSGTRLWPLSNEVRSKQFLKIFKKEDGTRESMVQRMYHMIKTADKEAKITIATSELQVPQIKSALGDIVDISVEPCRKDTFPAIALACAYLVKNGVSIDEPVIVSPVDPYVDYSYFEMFKALYGNADNANITLMGIKPTYPSSKYGYIVPNVDCEKRGTIDAASDNSCDPIPVDRFVEKPNEKEAQNLIGHGALWNSGVYSFKLSYILRKARELLGFNTYSELYSNYENLNKISIDYAIAENEKSINVIKYDGEWKDLGTWNTLTEAMSDKTSGEVIGDGCNNTHIINELSLPVVCIGIDNAVVVATPDGILVSDKTKSQKVKELVKNNRPMYEKRFWGEYKVLDYKIYSNGKNSLTKELIIKDGKHISYQKHNHRMEIWTIIDGNGIIVLNGLSRKVSYGDNIVIKQGVKHAIKAINELHIIEVQVGDELTEDDIERFDYKWE